MFKKYGFIFVILIHSINSWAFEMKGTVLTKALTEAKIGKCSLSEKQYCELFIFIAKNVLSLSLTEISMDKKITMKGISPSFRDIGEFFERLKLSPNLEKDLLLLNSKTIDGTPRKEMFEASVSYKK